MRAFAVKNFGEAPAVHDLPVPDAEDAFLIRVAYAGVNPVDFKIVDGLTAASKFPHTVGIDFAGVLQRVPVGNHGFHSGDRVFGMAPPRGTYAEFTALGEDGKTAMIAHTPDSVGHDSAAALPVPATTALGSLDLLAVAAGHVVVVMGAAGGVGGYAVQMACARGARVIATVRGDADEARRLGAQDAIDATAGDVIDAIRTAYPDGVDAVLDLVNGQDAVRRDADILKSGGRFVSTIHAADEAWFRERNIEAHNIGSNNNPHASPEGLATVVKLLEAGTITARIRATAGLGRRRRPCKASQRRTSR